MNCGEELENIIKFYDSDDIEDENLNISDLSEDICEFFKNLEEEKHINILSKINNIENKKFKNILIESIINISLVENYNNTLSYLFKNIYESRIYWSMFIKK